MIRVYIGAFTVVVIFGSGWTARDWYQSSVELERVTAFKAEESSIAKLVEQKLQGLRANERIIERWKTKVVDRPVYHVDCIDADGLRIIRDYASGTTESANKMPD